MGSPFGSPNESEPDNKVRLDLNLSYIGCRVLLRMPLRFHPAQDQMLNFCEFCTQPVLLLLTLAVAI